MSELGLVPFFFFFSFFPLFGLQMLFERINSLGKLFSKYCKLLHTEKEWLNIKCASLCLVKQSNIPELGSR